MLVKRLLDIAAVILNIVIGWYQNVPWISSLFDIHQADLFDEEANYLILSILVQPQIDFAQFEFQKWDAFINTFDFEIEINQLLVILGKW